MSAENIHIAGRYNKYLRNLSQSPWIDKDDVRVKDSVQELIEDGLRKYLKFDKSVFASSGREDVDVRMLGRGRPFTFKIINPQLLNDYNNKTLREIEQYVNSEHAGKVGISDLQIVTKFDVTKYMTETLESKQKEYRALCCCTRQLSASDIEKINSTKILVIDQVTPIRVLHRRTLANRERTIYKMRIERVKEGDFDSVGGEYLDRVFALTLTTEAGTYIKEFVHGDFGRTKPSLASILGGDCETDLMELDVMEVHSDWPPKVDQSSTEVGDKSNLAKMSLHGVDERSEDSPRELAELYAKGVKLLKDAEIAPRGDKRQDMYMQSRQLFQKAITLADKLSLFSDNETVEDIATADLKYLLIWAHLAKTMTSAECGSQRLETFLRAQDYIISFFRRISHYRLGNDAVEQALGSANNDICDMEMRYQAKGVGAVSLEDAMRERSEKIERYKKIRGIEEKMAELESRMSRCDGGQVDEEVAREYYLSQIKRMIEEALDTLEREIKPAIYFERNRSGSLEQEVGGSGARPKGKMGQPITIVRDQLQKQVMGLGYPSRPTVTVDEFITKKINDGELAFDKHKEVYTNSLQRYAEQPNLRRDQEEMSDEERELKEERDDEEEMQRKRKWDEFKDDNPRGSGNRHNMG